MQRRKIYAIVYAVMAAVFYAVNVPLSKLLLDHVGTATMAALLYLGAGIGIGIMSLLSRKNNSRENHLTKSDLPFVIGMILLDIAAPIILMLGIRYGSSANASLLGNFEIVATTLIALFIFKEAVSRRLWAAISFIMLKEQLSVTYVIAFLVMTVGTILVVLDTLIRSHTHEHQHTFTYTHDGYTHTHTITHSHPHNHYLNGEKHDHHHTKEELEKGHA